MRMIVGLLALSTLMGVACRDEGPARRQQPIFQIKVTPAAAQTDTIRVSFATGGTACDVDAKVEVQFRADALRLIASSVPAAAVCVLDVATHDPFIYIVAPPHSSPYTIRFAEPGEADSVRVVPAP